MTKHRNEYMYMNDGYMYEYMNTRVRGGNRAGRAGPGQQLAGPKPGRVKIGRVFLGQNFNSSARPKNRAGRAK